MSSNEVPSNENGDDKSSMPSTPTTTGEYNRTFSQDLRHLDDALTYAIDQLTVFNREIMSDLSLKYELMRTNESRVIGFFARQQLMLSQLPKTNNQNGGFHSEYSKLDRFLSVINLNKKSIEYIAKRMTFDDLLNGKATIREKLLYDAETTEAERKDFRNALNALKDCIDYFSHGGTNDNGRFYWHIETPPPTTVTPYSIRQHRLSDTALSVPLNTDSGRSPSVSLSLSTEFGAVKNNNNQTTITSLPPVTRNNFTHMPPPSRSTHLYVNGKGKCEHPSKKSSVDPSIFANVNPSRSIDLQIPDGGSASRRSSYGSDTESQLPSEFEHSLKNETLNLSHNLAARKIAMASYKNYYHSNSMPSSIMKQQTRLDFIGKIINSNIQLNSDNNINDENKIISKPTKKRFWDRSFSKDGTATPNSPTIRSPTMPGSPMGSACNSDTENDPKTSSIPIYNIHSPILGHRMAHKIQHKYKCHKECVSNAPANCGFSEGKFRQVIDNTDIQNAFVNSSPSTRKYHFTPSDSTSPTPSTPISAPGSPAPHPLIPGYNFTSSTLNGNPSICVSESIYCKNPESQSDCDTNSTIHTDPGTNVTDLPQTPHSKLVQQSSYSEPVHPSREDFKSKLAISFDDDDVVDPEKRSINLSTSIQDWVIVFNNIKMIEEVRRSSGTLMKAHWHGELAVRIIKPDPKISEVEFLNQFKNQIFRLRKVRHEHLNLYTGVCIENPNFAIASNWIRGATLFEMIHIRNDLIPLNLAVNYAAQIAQAMSYLHEKSINHMSLRTSNIFVQNNRIILTDYGLIPLSKCYRYTTHPAIIAPRGWLSYLAPEIIRKLDPRHEQTLLQHTPQTDVYAFGTVWYELLFREFPFSKQPPEYIIWRAGNSLKQPLSSVHISKNAKDIINQCWSFVPDDRPDFAMLCKSLTKMPGKRTLVRSPSTPLQYHGHQISNHHFS
ncbi:unnamed protein product [Rotaria sp. Silwood1]|nr:unnamed protein product [Rotaria sp. Silwood1]CAF4511103.1 unnamed protein product [Rotaria sp. Silwood1]CAF4657896.1 unnamed protein product [Rotaria sp. Silwood1]CAF4658268.1 unnamed protein product [Rotaria sp. Silwood1]